MSSLLCLWDYDVYLRDVRDGVLDEPPSYNSRQERLHTATSFGGTVFLLTCVDDKCYVVGKLRVGKRVNNPLGAQYGPYGLVGAEGSAYYPVGAIDVTDVLPSLKFDGSRWRIPPKNDPRRKPLAQYLQTMRSLDPDDVALLNKAISRTVK